jgi:hypothetical protein
MTDIFEDIFEKKEQGAPEERKEAEIVDFPEPAKRNKGGGSKPGRPMPWNDGNQFAVKHGAYSIHFSPEEQQERTAYENRLISDLHCEPSTAEMTLIHRASFLEMRLRRTEKAGPGAVADGYVLSWINSQRLLLCALGLKKTLKSEEPGMAKVWRSNQ